MKKKQKQKSYVLKNFDDIYKVVNDQNIKNLIEDVALYIYFLNDTKKELRSNKISVKVLEDFKMRWVNDGINEITGIEIEKP